MVIQYPHQIVLEVIPPSTKDENGNWTNGIITTLTLKGRAEPAGSNGIIQAADGTLVRCKWICYLPLPVDTIAPGSKVTITNGDDEVGSGEVQRFSKGQLNARLWV